MAVAGRVVVIRKTQNGLEHLRYLGGLDGSCLALALTFSKSNKSFIFVQESVRHVRYSRTNSCKMIY